MEAPTFFLIWGGVGHASCLLSQTETVSSEPFLFNKHIIKLAKQNAQDNFPKQTKKSNNVLFIPHVTFKPMLHPSQPTQLQKNNLFLFISEKYFISVSFAVIKCCDNHLITTNTELITTLKSNFPAFIIEYEIIPFQMDYLKVSKHYPGHHHTSASCSLC